MFSYNIVPTAVNVDGPVRLPRKKNLISCSFSPIFSISVMFTGNDSVKETGNVGIKSSNSLTS